MTNNDKINAIYETTDVQRRTATEEPSLSGNHGLFIKHNNLLSTATLFVQTGFEHKINLQNRQN